MIGLEFQTNLNQYLIFIFLLIAWQHYFIINGLIYLFILTPFTEQGSTSARDLSEVDTPRKMEDIEMSDAHDDDMIHEEDDQDEDNDDHEHDHDTDSQSMKKESCLKHIYPAIYDDEYERLRLVERVADLFRFCLGVRGSLRMGPTGFRTFARYILFLYLSVFLYVPHLFARGY